MCCSFIALHVKIKVAAIAMMMITKNMQAYLKIKKHCTNVRLQHCIKQRVKASGYWKGVIPIFLVPGSIQG